jgi:uncharacterized membrane protein YcaP (DUF421 family)
MFIEISFAFFENSAWSNMFELDPGKVFWIEKVIRPIAVYFFLLIMFRVLGNRELAQLNPMDLILLLLLSNTVQNAIIGDDTSLSGGLVGAIALLGINYAMVFLKFKNERFEKFVEGKERVLVDNGKIDEKILRGELLTKSDLNTLAHEKDFESTDDIKRCVIDPNGTFFVEGSEQSKDDDFKKEVLEKIDTLTKQISDLQNLLQKNKV